MSSASSEENAPSLTFVTPTLCKLMGVAPPAVSVQGVVDAVIQEAATVGVEHVQKCLVYCPDAVGTWLYRAYPSMFEGVLRHAPLAIPLRSALPTVTPVCFASMFTGGPPAMHGIRRYERPVLTCDTIFDALVRAGKKVAIVAVEDSSMDLIFRQRELDYFSERDDEQVTERTVGLLDYDAHDFIVAYHQEYDDALHATTPHSPRSLLALRHYVASFGEIARKLQERWKRYDRAIVFAPDHGAHVDGETGKGSHGADVPEDVCVTHFFGFATAEAR